MPDISKDAKEVIVSRLNKELVKKYTGKLAVTPNTRQLYFCVLRSVNVKVFTIKMTAVNIAAH
jgi:hypothetical protein